MKNLKSIIIMLLAVSSIFAACSKKTEEVAAPQLPTTVTAKKPKPVGEQMIYVGPHPSCGGALLFKRSNGQFLRAVNYPADALQLQPGDTVFVVFEEIKSTDGIEFATPPVEISKITLAAQNKTAGKRVE